MVSVSVSVSARRQGTMTRIRARRHGSWPSRVWPGLSEPRPGRLTGLGCMLHHPLLSPCCPGCSPWLSCTWAAALLAGRRRPAWRTAACWLLRVRNAEAPGRLHTPLSQWSEWVQVWVRAARSMATGHGVDLAGWPVRPRDTRQSREHVNDAGRCARRVALAACGRQRPAATTRAAMCTASGQERRACRLRAGLGYALAARAERYAWPEAGSSVPS